MVEGVNRSENEGMRFGGCTKWVVNVRYCGLLCCVICKRSKAEFIVKVATMKNPTSITKGNIGVFRVDLIFVC